MTEIHDYNGTEEWSGAAIRERYLQLARAMGQTQGRDLTPREHSEDSTRWVYPVMDEVIDGIKAGDLACVELGVQFIERAGKQAFGRILHANTARALRRATLSPTQIERLRSRILDMLVKAQVPHEYREYAKLLRRIGIGSRWPRISAAVDRANPYVMRYVQYFERHAKQDEQQTPKRSLTVEGDANSWSKEHVRRQAD
jgi:hypothetical protein